MGDRDYLPKPPFDALDVPEVEAPSDLAASVLARTTGSACSRAREILPSLTGETATSVDAELLALHLERCGPCAELSLALDRLAVDLPALAEVRPDRRFAWEVLARTARRPSQGLDTPLRRPAAVWQRLVVRPRFAAEGAYLGSLLIAAVVSMSGATVAGVSRDAAFAATTNPVSALKPLGSGAVEAARDLAARTELLAAPTVGGLERSWTATTTSLRQAARRVAEAFGGDHDRTKEEDR